MADSRGFRPEDLLEATLLRSGAERAAFLDGIEALDPGLRREIESLLLSRPPADALETFAEQGGIRGEVGATLDRIGPYRVLREIGAGGMGVVYEAEQEAPVRRKVALKLIKWGMDTKQVIARFESERQALALMNHPNIASVHDAGATDEGRPYFAMELVPGVPITEYCDLHRLTIRGRLELFIQVCEGVQHAHQKGIIHRDIKPSNVLVAIRDGDPLPKIIDFGVAKATSQRLTELTIATELGQLIGTPEYMSPEQAEMSNLDIDTRTDVYSLGVLLYELLVGTQPFDSQQLRSSSLPEIQRILREELPPRPSKKLSGLDDLSIVTAHDRRVDARVLVRQLRGDLDWIVIKTLEKDRTRRYETADALALDVRRFLDSEPVRARAPSTLYRAARFVRRHRVGVAAAAALLLALVGGAVGTAIGLYRAVRAEGNAAREAEAAQRVSDFLVGAFQISDPSESRGNAITAREILDRGASRIRTELSGNPLLQATLMMTMAEVYRSLGLYQSGAELLEDALAVRRRELSSRDPAVAGCLNDLGTIYVLMGKYETAEPLLREALSIRRDRRGSEPTEVAESLNALGTVLFGEGEYRDAEPLFREALAIRRERLGDEDLMTVTSLNDLEMTLQRLDPTHAEAVSMQGEVLRVRRRLLGDDHPEIAQSLNNLAMAHYRRKEFAEAEPLFREALSLNRRLYGDEHPEVSTNLNNLALLIRDEGDYETAEGLFREVLALDRKLLGADHPYVADTLNSLGSVLLRKGEPDAARSHFEQSLDLQRARFGEESWQAANTRSLLGAALGAEGRYEEAERLLLTSLSALEEAFGERHRYVLASIERVADLYRSWGKGEEASRYRTLLEVRETTGR